MRWCFERDTSGICNPIVIAARVAAATLPDGAVDLHFGIARGEGNSMMKEAMRIPAILCVILLLQSGCATDRIGHEAGEGSVHVEELVKTARSWDGAFLPVYPQGQAEITIVRVNIPAGVRLDMHSHPVINAGVLVSGQLTVVTADGKTLHLKAGDPIVEVVNTLHYGINEGTVPAEIVVVYAGAVGTRISNAK